MERKQKPMFPPLMKNILQIFYCKIFLILKFGIGYLIKIWYLNAMLNEKNERKTKNGNIDKLGNQK